MSHVKINHFFPKLNIFRKFLWKLAGKKLHKILTPTIDNKEMLVKNKIFKRDQTILLRDPIIDINEINFLKKNLATFLICQANSNY
ncbi:MAG: hypothetical protein RMX55_09230, partial [Planktomarina sp.]|nr:hypothetical protein [Planktomarina sp.]